MTQAIDLSQAELAMVTETLRAHLPPGTRVWVFGSRATGSARQYSDLDLAVEDAGPLSAGALGDVAEALSESDLPYKVDVLDLRSIDQSFRMIIEADMIEMLLWSDPERSG